ncbi:MAG: hypothetical protein ABIR66_03315 [Saprospiraceae bacterium]
MQKSKVYTSSLSSELSIQVEDYASTNKIPKIKVIEMALVSFFNGIEKQEFIDSLKKYGRDPEFVETAEWGMADCSSQLEKYPYESR